MATRNQYDVFKAAYDAEDERHDYLGGRARVYISLVTFFLSALFFKLEIVLQIARASRIAWCALVFTWIALFSAILFSFVSLIVRQFEIPFDPIDAADELDEEGATEEEFLENRIVDFSVVLDKNFEVNDRLATWLQASSVALLFAFGFAMLFLIVATYTTINLAK